MTSWTGLAIGTITLLAIMTPVYVLRKAIKQERLENHNTTATKLKLILVVFIYLISLLSTWIEIRFLKDITGTDPKIFPLIAISVGIAIFHIGKIKINRKMLITAGAISCVISIALLLALVKYSLASKGPGIIIFLIASALQMHIAIKYRPKIPESFETRITI